MSKALDIIEMTKISTGNIIKDKLGTIIKSLEEVQQLLLDESNKYYDNNDNRLGNIYYDSSTNLKLITDRLKTQISTIIKVI